MFEGQCLAVARVVEDGAIVGARVALAQEEGADARLLEHVAKFVRAVRGVDVDQDDARAGGGVLHQDPLDAVAGPYAGAVAGLQSQTGEPAGDAGGFLVQFTPRQTRVLMANHERFPFREALVVCHQDARLTWSELDQEATRVARGLAGLGLAPGDRAGIWASNCIEWILMQHAAARSGVI